MFTRLSKTMKIGLGVGGALLFLLIGIAAASPSSTPPVAEVAAAPAATPALSSSDQTFLSELVAYAPRFGAEQPDRAVKLLNTAKTNCLYLRGAGNGRTMDAALAISRDGFTLAEGLLFTNLAVKDLCPGADQPRVAVVAAPTLPPGSFTDGTYLVGTDMPAGYYVTDGTGSDVASGACYWSRSQNDGGSAGTIIKNSYSPGVGRFTTKAGEVVTLQHGCTWVKK